MPGLPSESFLDRLHRSSGEVVELHALRIDHCSARELGRQLSSKDGEVRAAAASRGLLPFPIKFDSLVSEVNFLAWFYLLNFGSGWEAELLQSSQRGAAETIQYGLIGMHISGQRLDHHFMKAFSPMHLRTFFGLESHVDQPLEGLPGVTISKPGPLHSLVVALQTAVMETGEALSQEGSSSLGQYILSLLAEAGEGRPTSAAFLVEELAVSLPGFRDQVQYEGRQLPFGRKAQALVAALRMRFGKEDPRFDFSGVGRLAADSGPSVIAALRAKGIIECPPELESTLESGGELPAGPDERALRAAAIYACDIVMEGLPPEGAPFSCYELGLYLGMLTEEGQELHGQARPHVTKCSAY